MEQLLVIKHLHVLFELVLQIFYQVANEPRRLFPEGLHLSGGGTLVLVSGFPAEGHDDGRRENSEMMLKDTVSLLMRTIEEPSTSCVDD